MSDEASPAWSRRRRGRPPKNASLLQLALLGPGTPEEGIETTEPQKRRGRGRNRGSDVVTAEQRAQELLLTQLEQGTLDASTFSSFFPVVDEPVATSQSPPSVLSRLRKGPPGSCDICSRTETSVWRKITLGGEDFRVCNRTSCQKTDDVLADVLACGLYYLRFKVIRPAELWGDGKQVRKRRVGPRAGKTGVEAIPDTETPEGIQV